MRKKLLIVIVASFMAMSLVSCGDSSKVNEDKSSSESTIQPAEAKLPEYEDYEDENRFTGEKMPDFSVKTIQGETFSLSDALKEKEAVMINFWATWCTPCKLEMPYMQKAYEQYKDKVDMIALSVEPTDTDDVLEEYAKENGLTFMVANGVETGLCEIYAEESIPVTLLVDRSGTIVHHSEGSKSSVEDFTTLFDSVIGDNSSNSGNAKDNAENTADAIYKVTITDQNKEAVQGCVVNFCDDSSCATIVSDENGIARHSGVVYPYHIQVVKVPDGYSYDTSQEYVAKEDGDEISVTVTKD